MVLLARLLLALAGTALADQDRSPVEVTEGSVRLAGGNTDAGRVEVFYQGRWGWLCLGPGIGAGGWGKAEADIVCKQLGLRKGVSTMRMANGPYADVLPIASVQCSGAEKSITDCKLELRSAEACSALAAAGVRCTNFVAEDQPRIELSGASPESLLADSSFRIECTSEPQAERVEHLPSFACEVQEQKASEKKIDSCSADQCAQGVKDLPDPFLLETALEAFVFKPAMEAHLKSAQEQRSAVSSGERVAAHGSTNCSAIGLEISPEEQDLAMLRRAYFSPLARLLFDLDADVIGLRGRKSGGFDVSESLSPAAAAVFTDLEESGAAELGDMGLSEELQQEALASLGDKAFDDRLAAVRTPLPLLERWLQENSTVRSFVAAYFGGHAMLHGYKVVHLPSSVTTEAFIAAHWHHDRAGRRLKMFILLNDVDPTEGHPTQVALGSHRLSYYWHEEFEQSRYDNAYVQRHFKTLRLAGKRGTGYIFDTNAIHKGTPEGSQGRNVIVVEYHQAAKCSLISRLGLNIPCPSGDQKALNWYFTLG